MGKNIVIFSDGTGQEGGDGTPTNVYKLYNMVLDRSESQVSYYDKGIGTNFLLRWFSRATGFGFTGNVRDCYNFIFENYQAGDKLYLFGFSRGAATVRSLSNFIHHFGVLPKSRPDIVDQAFKIYKIKDPAEKVSKAKAFIDQHHTMWTNIEFVGVWDTVVSLGFPDERVNKVIDYIPGLSFSFHEFQNNEAIIKGCHALSIDDNRESFMPTLWDEHANLEQVWFAGAHSDVGGGYEDARISDIALDWMKKKATDQGLEIYQHHKVEINPDIEGKVHDPQEGIARIFSDETRKATKLLSEEPVVHKSVKERHEKLGSRYHPWILKGPHRTEVTKAQAKSTKSSATKAKSTKTSKAKAAKKGAA